MGLPPGSASESSADEQSNGCSVPSMWIDTERRWTRPNVGRTPGRSRQPGALGNPDQGRGGSRAPNEQANQDQGRTRLVPRPTEYGGPRDQAWDSEPRLSAPRERSTAEKQNHSVELDVFGFIEGRFLAVLAPAFIHENQPFQVHVGESLAEFSPPLPDLRVVLLLARGTFFLRGRPSLLRAREMAIRLQSTPRRWRHSSSVASGCCRINSRSRSNMAGLPAVVTVPRSFPTCSQLRQKARGSLSIRRLVVSKAPLPHRRPEPELPDVPNLSCA